MDPIQSAEQFHKFMEDNKKNDLDTSPSFQDLLTLLKENGREVQEQDLSLMAWYLGGMELQFNLVLNELQNVKAQLARATEQQVPAKPALTRMVEALEAKVEQAKERLMAFRDKIVECAKDAADRFKDSGVSALDSAISAMGVKNGLVHLQEGLQRSISGVKDTLEKAESMGAELRRVGQGLKNVGRIAANREPDRDPINEAGRFQSAVLAPMRATQKLLSNINNNTLAAIGVVEDLEQSADMARDRQAERAAQRPGKRLEKKSSIRETIKENQAKIAESAPASNRDKAQEAAL